MRRLVAALVALAAGLIGPVARDIGVAAPPPPPPTSFAIHVYDIVGKSSSSTAALAAAPVRAQPSYAGYFAGATVDLSRPVAVVVAPNPGGGLASVGRHFGPGAAHVDDPGLGPRFVRGAAPGEQPTFVPRPNEFRVDPQTGFVHGTHGVSVFDNPTSVVSRGFDPYEIEMSSVPEELTFIQRGQDLAHYEIVPASGAQLTPEGYISSLNHIETW